MKLLVIALAVAATTYAVISLILCEFFDGSIASAFSPANFLLGTGLLLVPLIPTAFRTPNWLGFSIFFLLAFTFFRFHTADFLSAGVRTSVTAFGPNWKWWAYTCIAGVATCLPAVLVPILWVRRYPQLVTPRPRKPSSAELLP
ncbi:MAG: hypothetical protein SFX74_10015 [Fimbriimonadaceae bacterium]|nr:hypothetical protein [Fimbriimonadaceae bacterium]